MGVSRAVTMKNKAKCKKCESIIESFHASDYVSCKCGAIALDGGEAMYCFAHDWDDLIRVDDNGHEIIPKIMETKSPCYATLADVIQIAPDAIEPGPIHLGKKEVLDNIEQLTKIIEGLPGYALDSPITHRDYLSLLGLISSVLRLSS